MTSADTDAARSVLPTTERWQVEKLRLTAFPSAPLSQPIQDLWTNLFVGRRPDRVEENVQASTTIASGTIGALPMALVVNPITVEVQCLPVQATSGPVQTASPPSPGYEKTMEFFRDSAPPLCRRLPPLRRLAFGAQLHLPIPNLGAGRETLDRYLPDVQFRDMEIRDFAFQVNRRRSSQVQSGLELNRLSRWSVQEIQTVAIGLNAAAVTTTVTGHVCHLALDINTAPEHEPEVELSTELFGELMGLGDEIVRCGDVQ